MIHIDQLIRDAFEGQLEARKELYFRTQLVPELEEVLSEVFDTRPMIVMQPDELEADEVDTFSALKWTVVERTVAKVVIEASASGTPVIDTADKLGATQDLREALEVMVAWLDARIDGFHDQLDKIAQIDGSESASA